VVPDRFLPSGRLRFFGPCGWEALDDDTVLILGFARIREDLRLEEGDIAIELLELSGESVRL
jgi:hypothetical protein